MKRLKEHIGSLKEQIRIKDLQPRSTFTFDSNKHSDAVEKIKKGISTKRIAIVVFDTVILSFISNFSIFRAKRAA